MGKKQADKAVADKLSIAEKIRISKNASDAIIARKEKADAERAAATQAKKIKDDAEMAEKIKAYTDRAEQIKNNKNTGSKLLVDCMTAPEKTRIIIDMQPKATTMGQSVESIQENPPPMTEGKPLEATKEEITEAQNVETLEMTEEALSSVEPENKTSLIWESLSTSLPEEEPFGAIKEEITKAQNVKRLETTDEALSSVEPENKTSSIWESLSTSLPVFSTLAGWWNPTTAPTLDSPKDLTNLPMTESVTTPTISEGSLAIKTNLSEEYADLTISLTASPSPTRERLDAFSDVLHNKPGNSICGEEFVRVDGKEESVLCLGGEEFVHVDQTKLSEVA